MNRSSILLWLAWLTTPSLAATPSCMDRYINETLNYSLHLRGLPAAHARISCERTDQVVLTARIDTYALTGLMFKIHNTYTTLIDEQDKPLVYLKTIEQRNLSQSLRVAYDHKKGLAASSQDRQWAISPESLNLFTMLFRLRCLAPTVGTKFEFELDIEGQSWRASCTVSESRERIIAGQKVERTVEILFHAADSTRPRAWKTDLLTNRITRGQKLIILFGPEPDNIPLLLQFGEDHNRVEMKLAKQTRG